uniref:Tenascin-like n=1 Tax=Saccoglossus kowalevskii TaxID=10224 RepID=A0ABM0M793_SACKO|nr:PREDICTED: tenascin-like [Saccoglossus kowalevskii]
MLSSANVVSRKKLKGAGLTLEVHNTHYHVHSENKKMLYVNADRSLSLQCTHVIIPTSTEETKDDNVICSTGAMSGLAKLLLVWFMGARKSVDFLSAATQYCPSGTYGAGCTQTCHCTNGCNTKGECISSPGVCDTGWSGNRCKVPSSCPSGFYGTLCNYNCHCKNNAACDKNTGFCINGDCAPEWINLDTIDSDCQQACDKITGVCPNGDCSPGWINLDTIDSDCQQACDKNTGVCPNGECAPGWINLDTIDSDCQQGLYAKSLDYMNAAYDKNTGVCIYGDCATGWINLDTIDSDCQQACDKNNGVCPNGDCVPGWINLDTIDSYCQQVNPGEVTNFYCEVSGNPVFDSNDLKIWKSGTSNYLTLTNTGSSKYIIFGNSTSVVVDSGDMYSCGNSIGFLGSTSVQFYGLPRFSDTNKPDIDVSFDKLTVTWNKWTTDDIGDGPVESHKLYYRESDENDWISGQVIPVSDSSQMSYTSTIKGLQWSTQYEITVIVKRPGPLGEGSKDTTIIGTTLCATSQEPTIMNVFSPELKQLEVHVQIPDSSDIKCKKDGVDGYIDYIEVKYRKAGTEDEYEIGKIEIYQETVMGTKVIPFTAESLLPYTEYEVIALLRNADATSPPSNSVIVISHEDVPSRPRNVTLQPAVYAITVTWLEPDPPNGIITAYKITYWKTGDESTKKDILVDNGSAHELNIYNLDYEVNYTIIVSASTIVGEGEYSTEMNTKTSETIPREPAIIDVQRTTENSIRFTWTDPTIFCGDILQYRITYRSTASVYSTTVLESKDILVEGDINTYTLGELPRGTQFEISVSASTSKGFGKPNSIISGTTIVTGSGGGCSYLSTLGLCTESESSITMAEVLAFGSGGWKALSEESYLFVYMFSTHHPICDQCVL